MPAPNFHTPEDSRELLRRYMASDPNAAQAIVDRYLARLLPLIGKHLSPTLQQRFDPQDVAQSAFGSFFVQARDKRFLLQHSGDLWRLLAAISLNKLRRQAKRHSAGKRAVSREVATDLANIQQAPLPAEAVGLLEEVQLALAEMPADAQPLLGQFLAGQSLDELSPEHQKSPRTLRRWLQTFRDNLKRRLVQELPPFGDRIATLSWQDYILKQHIGSGGFGKVYRAIEKRRHRTVAVKSLHKRHQTNPFALGQLIRESQLMAKVCHPGIVGLHGLGQYPGGGYFLVMDWVDGENLQQRIDRAALPVSSAIRIVRHVAVAIAAAHRSNVIHGDLKPSNILLSRQNTVYVVDFGLASLHSQIVDTPPVRGGTLAYLAPEQLTSSAADFTVDVYGLGGLLYALLTGKPPRCGEPIAILSALEQGDLPLAPASLGMTLPTSLETFLMRCLATNPSERPSSAQQFLHELARITSEDTNPTQDIISPDSPA
ncbi:hypothetical protein DTL42_03675 [Bremerella cremea]|uniref:Protein kinase domain-containing protein n=1 Tax=Bremerella cremea TaxID=1031537 RepID=A0A368KVC9_9BACT|nr:protein kinase [Bremerella cremea]RCS54256.1 hypothetical protein DTL42_03675 [Bremerella cremea]